MNFLQPKGSVQKNDNKALIDALAKQNTIAALDADTQKNDIKEALKNATTQALLENIESPVAVPKITTLKDVLTSDNRMGSLADYISTNPDFAGLVGGLIGGSTWDNKGDQVYGGDIMSRETESRFNRDRDVALAQQKQQNDLADGIYKEFNDMDVAQLQNDLAREKMAQDAEQFNQRLALDRESMRMGNALAQQRLNEAIRHNRAMESGNTTNGTNSTRDLQELKNQLDSFSSSFDKVDNPYRYRIAGGVSNKLNTLSNEEANFNAQRTLLFNQVARKLGGEKGVLSDQDIKRIDDSLPKLSDTKAQKMAKMESIYNLLDIRAGNSIGTSYNSAKQNSGLKVDKSAIQAEMKRRGLK